MARNRSSRIVNSQQTRKPRLRPNTRVVSRGPDAIALETKLVNGPTDPRTALSDLIFTKVFTTTQILASGTATITAATIKALLSTSVTAAYSFRIQKISAYASAAAGSFVGVQLSSSDEGQYIDYGTQGSVRPQVHIRPSMQFRQTWLNNATPATNLFSLTGTATDTVVLQITLEVRIALPFL